AVRTTASPTNRRRIAVKRLAVALFAAWLVPGAVVLAQTTTPPAAKPAAPAPSSAAPAKPKGETATVVTLRGTVEAIDKDKQTVTIKGPKRTLTVRVQDPKKLEAIKVGDPVVGKYYEAIAFEVKKPGTATPGVTAQQGVATSQPGAMPAGAVGQQITVTVTIVAIAKAAHTATIKGPQGN